MLNPINLLKRIFQTPRMIPADVVTQGAPFSDADKELLKRIGMTTGQMSTQIQEGVLINFERSRLYKEIDRSLLHWLVGSAVELYGDVATTFSSLHNATVWVTSSNSRYETELTNLLDRVGIEERIFDWATTVGAYGDLFVEINASPNGLGVISVDDSQHPINTSRVDKDGVLVGFFETPIGNVTETRNLRPPWDFVHFRILGSKRKRPLYDDPMYSEYRTIHLLAPDTRRVTSEYGASLLINALPVYKRLRLAEDSLLMARLTRGILKYIYKVRVDSTNIEGVSAILDEVTTTLKRARALNNTPDNPNYDSKSNPMACLRGDTSIRLCGGENVLIEDLVGNKEDYIGKYTWSVNPVTLEMERTKITRAERTRTDTQLVRVYLNNNEHVDCTPDHLFMLRGGEYKEAQGLKVDESLMSYNSFLTAEGMSEARGHDARLHRVSNHKVVKVEWLTEEADTYDITVEKNHNFSLSCGIFVHNSVEDIILPVWGDANDITIDKIGGEADIKWIVDIEELRNQLASALRTPLSLIGGFVEEASGALGSQAIEKLDIRFARSARRLQRSLIEGIKRLCQVHLAYIGMDPDASLFDVNMTETSSAEEEELKNSLDTGMDVVTKAMDMFDGLGVELDKVELLNYFNQKILKLNDLDLENYKKTGELKDSVVRKDVKKQVRGPLPNSDLRAWTIRESDRWDGLYGKCTVKTTIKGVGK